MNYSPHKANSYFEEYERYFETCGVLTCVKTRLDFLSILPSSIPLDYCSYKMDKEKFLGSSDESHPAIDPDVIVRLSFL